MSELNIGYIKNLEKTNNIFDLKVALALKVGKVSRTDLARIEILEKTIEETMKKVKEAEIDYDLNRAAELKYGIGADYNEELETLKLKIRTQVKNLFINFPFSD